MTLPRNKVAGLRALVLRWYAKNARRLPWRGNVDPYGVLISEVMLQQTQVNRVLIKYPQFMALFPTMRRLAEAPQREVVTAWQGMGYNNRAVRLHRLAVHMVGERNGKWPADVDGLRQLPGVGRYTAHAMLAFAFRKDVPVVDVNVRRVLSRVFWRMPHTGSARKEEEIWTAAARIVPRGKAYDWNQALMDLGASICTARSPACRDCPVRAICASTGRMKRSAIRVPIREAARRGVPNRVYRGKIIDVLRSEHAGLLVEQLGPRITPDFRREDLRWLRSLVDALHRDGLVRITRGRNASHRVSLA